MDVVGNVRCTAGIDLNYSAFPTFASNQIGYNGVFTIGTGSTKTTNAGHYVHPFNNTFYFPIGVYLFNAASYSYDQNHSMETKVCLTTTNGNSNASTIFTTTVPTALVDPVDTVKSSYSSVVTNNVTQIIKVSSASAYYAVFYCTPVIASGTITMNSGGFRCSFVRIA